MLILDLKLFDHEYFFKSFRMSPTKIELLLSWVAPHIIKSSERRPSASPATQISYVSYLTIYLYIFIVTYKIVLKIYVGLD